MATNNNQKNKQGFGSTSQKQLSTGAKRGGDNSRINTNENDHNNQQNK